MLPPIDALEWFFPVLFSPFTKTYMMTVLHSFMLLSIILIRGDGVRFLLTLFNQKHSNKVNISHNVRTLFDF